MQFGDLTAGEGHQPHVGERHPFVEAGDVLLTARQAIERFRENHVKTTGERILNE